MPIQKRLELVFQSSDIAALCHLLAVNEKNETLAVAIMVARLVVYDRDVMTMIEHVVETEPVPLAIRQKRIYHDAAVGLRTQTADARNHQVVKSRVVVVAAALAVAHEPCPVSLVEIFADVWFATMVLTLYIHFHLMEEILIANNRVRVVVDIVAHGGERLTCSERPYRSVPFTFAGAVGAE